MKKIYPYLIIAVITACIGYFLLKSKKEVKEIIPEITAPEQPEPKIAPQPAYTSPTGVDYYTPPELNRSVNCPKCGSKNRFLNYDTPTETQYQCMQCGELYYIRR